MVSYIITIGMKVMEFVEVKRAIKQREARYVTRNRYEIDREKI